MKKKSIMLTMLMMASTVIFAQRHDIDSQTREKKFGDYMKKELSLSDDQYLKVKAINQAYHDRFRSIRNDSTLSKEASRAAMKKVHDEYNAALKGELTDKQYAQWTSLKANHAGRTKRVEARAEFMKMELSLNDDQYSKVKTINKTFGDRFKTLRSDSTLTKEASQSEFRKIREEKNTAIKGVLTDEQYTKWLAMKASHHGGKGDRKRKGASSPDDSRR